MPWKALANSTALRVDARLNGVLPSAATVALKYVCGMKDGAPKATVRAYGFTVPFAMPIPCPGYLFPKAIYPSRK